MLLSSIPSKFSIPWGNSAGGGFIRAIPTASQIGITPGAASLTDGFVPLNMTPVASGGIPPFGQDMNGILKQVTQWSQWQNAGGTVPWDSAFSTAIGGYPNGAVVASAVTAGLFFYCTADNNTSNPDTGGANWSPFSFQGSFTTGDVKSTFKTAADTGWVMMNDGSIGDASSGSTTLASATTAALFALLYNNVVDAWAPIQTSGGGATTRAAQGTAAAAYAAHCRLVLPLSLGRAISNAGAGAGLTSRALGSNGGEENHLLSVGEMPAHAHTYSDPGHTHIYDTTISAGGGTSSYSTNGTLSVLNTGSSTIGITINNNGGGAVHNNIQPTTYLNVMIKL